MNNSAKNNWLLWAVIVLIIANVALLSTIWILHYKQNDHRGSAAEFLVKELNLNDKQKEQLHQMAEEHHKNAEKIQEEIKNSRDSFFNLLGHANVSDSAKNAISAGIAAHLQQIEILTFNHFQQVRSICNPEQQKKFDEIIQDVLRMMAPPRPPQGNGNPPPPQGEHRLPPPPENGDPPPAQ